MDKIKIFLFLTALRVMRRLPAERGHHLALKLLSIAPRFCVPQFVNAPREVWGLSFKNPIGIAAGLDSNGDYIDALAKLNPGFIEVGGVTPTAQAGNPQPRIFRLPHNRAVINRMGFCNKGVDYLVTRLKTCCYRGIIGVNIAKAKDTPLEEAWKDFEYSIKALYPYASYLVINVSSPNTPQLRKMQFGELLVDLLKKVKSTQAALKAQTARTVPILVKVSSDMNDDELQTFAKNIAEQGMDGIVVSNTSTNHQLLQTELNCHEMGGISGAPLKPQALHALKVLHAHLPPSIPIIGVGGIMSAEDARERLASGAALIELYTGLLYGSGDLFNPL